MASILFGSKSKKLSGENLIRCLLCANGVNDPCYLSCCKDVFCRECLSNYSSYQKTSRYGCVSCVSQNNYVASVPGIPSDNRCKLFGSCSVIEGDWGKCNECRRQRAAVHCISCSEVPSLCKECVKKHETDGHLVVESAATIHVKCVERKHSSTELNAFCENCDLPCCQDCSKKNHQGHRISNMDSVIEERRTTLGKIQEELRSEVKRANVAVQQLRMTYKRKVSEMHSLMKDVSAHIARVIESLRRNELELKKSFEQICKAAENAMDQQVTLAKYASRRMQRLVCLINDFSHPGQKFPFLLHFSNLRRYADQLCQQNKAVASAEVVRPLTMRHCFQANNFPDGIGTIVEDSKPGMLEAVETLSKSDTAAVTDDNTLRSNGSVVKDNGSGDKGLSDNRAMQKAEVEILTKPGKLWFRFQQRPDGSSTVPFGTCFASYENSSKCVVAQNSNSSLLVINDVNSTNNFREIKLRNFCPRSVVQMSGDNIHRVAVTDNFDMQIKIVDCFKDRARHDSTLIAIEHKFVDPSGLAIFPNSQSFIVSDIHQPTVNRLTPEGRLLWSVAGFADFLVVDRHNRIVFPDRRQNCVKVIDGEGHALTQFGSDVGLSSPLGICFDRCNSFYVADSANHRVLMFSSDGRFMQEVVKTDWPNGVALSRDGKYLCVTSKDGNITMFKITK